MTRRSFKNLGRDARDTLFLLATIAAVVLPHAGHLPTWASAITALMLGWRAMLAWRGHPLPGRWVLVAVLLLSAALTWLTHRTLLGREAGVTMLVMLMAMKTLELRARRDAFVVFFLGFFLVLTQFLYSQSMLTALWMMLSVWALLSALVLAQMPVGTPSLRLAAKLAARSTLYGLPVMLCLFLLFPRIGPLWGVPADSVGRTGLSDRLDFGAMSEIANDDSVALRLRFAGPPPPPAARYFRGPVLGQFDGRSWRPSALSWPGKTDALQVSGQPLDYEMTVEPLRSSVLPMLEMSAEPAGTERPLDSVSLKRAPELQWLATRPITERLRLNAQVFPAFRHGPLEASLALQNYLELPPGFNPRTLQWAAALRREARFAPLDQAALSPALAAAVLGHISSADFIYTLAPGRYGEVTPHLIDEFWFDRRLGFCEHFSAGFVVVMRAMGVPARIVTGFQGMDAQPQDGFWIVRNSNAHAWAEYWVPGRGWLRADPTAAVAPERIQLGQALRPAPGVFAGAFEGAFGQINPQLWLSMRRGWEALENRWQQNVLNYSRQSQFDLLKAAGFAAPDWNLLGQVSAVLIALAALAGGAWSHWHARPHDAWSRQRTRILRELRRWGLQDAAAHQGPRQWASLLRARHGQAAESAAAMLLALEMSRYAPPDPAKPLPKAGSAWTRWQWLQEFRAAGRMLRGKNR
jgi:transglutaminase-like putative cysteine protease